jgi:hypothetical protein
VLRVISFGTNTEDAPALAAMQKLPDMRATGSRLPAPLIPAKMIDAAMVNGPWERLGAGHPAHEGGTMKPAGPQGWPYSLSAARPAMVCSWMMSHFQLGEDGHHGEEELALAGR